MEHMALRARSPQALERRVAALKGSGRYPSWIDGDMGRGLRSAAVIQRPYHRALLRDRVVRRARRTRRASALKNQAQRFPARGVNVDGSIT